jgi:hypothetical protein
MIVSILAAAMTMQAPPDLATGEWVVVSIHRVIAPDQIPGQCFVEARIDQVVSGRRFRAGDPVAITMACRADEMAVGEAVTVANLKAQTRALVRLDVGGRVAKGGWYALEAGEVPAL